MHHFLNTADKESTSNMCKHAKHCWGEDIIKKADEVKEQITVYGIWEHLAEVKQSHNGSIVAFFDRKGKGRVKYMLQQVSYFLSVWLFTIHSP